MTTRVTDTKIEGAASGGVPSAETQHWQCPRDEAK